MKKILELKRKDNKTIPCGLIELGLDDIDDIMELQNTILDNLDDKELYAPTEKKVFKEYINDLGKIIGIRTLEDNKLIAMGVYVENGYNEHNYGYDIGIEGDELLTVGQIESTVVLPEYRGNRLQKLICNELEYFGKTRKIKIISATASPKNSYSVNTFTGLGYKIMKEKEKYGGLKRYILAKYI